MPDLVYRDYSKYIHSHTQSPAQTSILTIQNFITQLKTGSKQRFETDEGSSTEYKTQGPNEEALSTCAIFRTGLTEARHLAPAQSHSATACRPRHRACNFIVAHA